MKIKSRGKRRISILTVFLWISLIAVMTVITISGITKSNSLEENKKNITIKVDVSAIGSGFVFSNCYILQNDNVNSIDMKLGDNNIVTASFDVETDSSYNILISEENGFDLFGNEKAVGMTRYNGNIYYCIRVEKDDLNTEYSFKLYKRKIENMPNIYNSVKWIDYNNKEAQIEFKYDSILYYNSGRLYYDLNKYYTIYYLNKESDEKHPNYIIFKEILADNFTISDEYLNDKEWKILDDVSDEESNDIIYLNTGFCTKNIPSDITKSFIINYDETWLLTSKEIEYTEIKYVYVKSTNTIYCIEDDVKKNGSKKINIKYIGENNLELKEQELNVSKEIEIMGIGSWSMCGVNSYYEDRYILDNNYLKLENLSDAKILVIKLVNGEKGNNTYYVGLFNNEIDEKADRIYNIDTVDGVGSINIELENYDESQKYYIYEVDEYGNKIKNDKLEYNKNKVLENINIVPKLEIKSLKDVISLVATNAKMIDNGFLLNSIEVLPEEYVDNTLVTSKTYEDIVTISDNYKEKMHLVKYIARDGGTLDGVSEEIVKYGGKPANVPAIIPNENYEFDKWIVIKDGEEIAVKPSEYVIEEDTTFIALFKKRYHQK